MIPHKTSRFRALVVDDDVIARRTVAFALAKHGFVCELAFDGEHAKSLLAEGRYDLLVTDLCMPRKNGHALAVDLLRDNPRPVIIVHTAVQEPRLSKDLLVRGVDDVVCKPADYDALAVRARSLVESRRRRPAPAAPVVPPHVVPPPAAAAAPVEAAQSVVECAGPVQTKHVVGVLTRDADRSKEIANEIRSGEVETLVATSSEELHRSLNRQRIDALVIEHHLDGFLSGIDLFSRLFDQLIRPKSILLADDSQSIHDEADKLGIDLVMQSNASPTDIQLSLSGLLATGGELDAFIPPPAVQLVRKYGDIPPLPQLLVRLTGYMGMPLFEIPLSELAKDISIDAKATSDLLRLTNSSAAGVSSKITSVLDAVKLHGPKKTIALILGSAVTGIQSDLLRDWEAPLRTWYQKRSVLIASTAATFANRLENISADTAFILGLLQDIGCLVLARRFSHQYQGILARFRSIGPVHLYLMEEEDFRVNHAEVSAALMLNWEVPQSLIRPVVAHHHLDATGGLSPIEESLTRVMRIGEALANLSDVVHPFRRNALNRLMEEYGSRRTAECRSAISESIMKSAELCHLFNLPAPTPAELERMVSRTLDMQSEAAAAST